MSNAKLCKKKMFLHIECDLWYLSSFCSLQISQNFKAVIKALQLFDYNRDGKIQRHELRRVIENYCFKLTDDQFQK